MRIQVAAAWAAGLVALSAGAQGLSISEHVVSPGGLVDVPVLVSNATGLASASLTINYDPQMLSLESVTNCGLGQGFAVEYGASEGQVRVAAVSQEALTGGSGALVVLRFRANSGAVAGLSSPIAFADRGLGGQYGKDLAWSANVSHSNGVVQIVNQAGVPNGRISVLSGVATVKMFGTPGFQYDVQRSTDLNVWKTLTSPPLDSVPPFTPSAVDGSFSFTDTFSDLSSPPPEAYYRILPH